MTCDSSMIGSRKLKFFKQFVYVLFVVVFMMYVLASYSQFDDSLSSPYAPAPVKGAEYQTEPQDVITILYWTKYYSHDPLTHTSIGTLLERRPSCFKKCRIVSDQSYLNDSDAVLFHSRDLRLDEMPRIRSSKQIWIYLQGESPAYTKSELNMGDYANVFNWTLTYRRDSDIFDPYGQIIKRNLSLELNASLKQGLLEIVKQKRYQVFWIVSNCDTHGKRENLVAELQQYIPIDIYGECGDYPCSHENGGCLSRLAPQYKFYLSFENSLCWDYVTEKLYNALNYDVIPIVYGGADYDTFAPPNSVINVNQFNSTEALANYLKYLDANPEEYLKYFEWKREYQVKENLWMDLWCNLCSKLVEERRNPQTKVYRDLWEWWNFVNISKSKDSIKSVENSNITPDLFPACYNASSSLPQRSVFDWSLSLPFRKLKWLYYNVLGY